MDQAGDPAGQLRGKMRSCIQFKVNGHWLRGACHEPSQPGGVGVLYGNSGWLPRSGRGDLSVRLADVQAGEGYWAFRFDMPGLGDSDGELPAETAPLLNMIQIGGHGPFTYGLAVELKKRYGLEKIILAGHCGSAMSAVYACLLDDGGVVSGLILMDMVFEAIPKEALQNGEQKKKASALAKARSVARKLVRTTPGGDKLQAFYRRAKRAVEQIKGMDIPANSNTRLMDAWRKVMAKRLPTLVISARHPTAPPRFDYLSYLKIQMQPTITALNVEGTTHSFLERNGGATVQSYCENWLRENFPLKACIS